MNKKLTIFQGIIFLITTCLLIGIRFVHSTISAGVLIMYLFFIIFVIMCAIDIKKKNDILNDKLYLMAFLMVFILTDVILIRSIFDTNIITVGFMNNFDESYQMIFLKSNMWLINTLFALLLTYRLTYQLKLPKISIQISFKNKSEK